MIAGRTNARELRLRPEELGVKSPLLHKRHLELVGEFPAPGHLADQIWQQAHAVVDFPVHEFHPFRSAGFRSSGGEALGFQESSIVSSYYHPT